MLCGTGILPVSFSLGHRLEACATVPKPGKGAAIPRTNDNRYKGRANPLGEPDTMAPPAAFVADYGGQGGVALPGKPFRVFRV